MLTPNGVCVMFSCQPFTTNLIASNQKRFRNIWYWQKTTSTGHLLTKAQPLRVMEEICVFGRNPGAATYNPQMVPLAVPYTNNKNKSVSGLYNAAPWDRFPNEKRKYTHAHPKNILQFSNETKRLLPTQKPVALLWYLVRTYSNLNDMVLAPTLGTGSTGVAAVMEDRDFTGFEVSPKHFDWAERRIEASVVETPEMAAQKETEAETAKLWKEIEDSLK